MSGGVWDHRLLRSGEYELRRDGAPSIFVAFDTRVPRQSLLAQAFVEAVARVLEEDVAASLRGIDWRQLGWDNQSEHDTHLTDQRARAGGLSPVMQAWVRDERRRQQIPDHAPYSVDQLDTIDSLITRAPHVVAQDQAAEAAA